jgi:hypothetical protein
VTRVLTTRTYTTLADHKNRNRYSPIDERAGNATRDIGTAGRGGQPDIRISQISDFLGKTGHEFVVAYFRGVLHGPSSPPSHFSLPNYSVE